MSAFGLALALVIDLVLPVALIIWLSRGNYRRRLSPRADRLFWGWLAAYAGLMGIWVVVAVIDVPRLGGAPVLTAVFFSLPMSAIPSIVNSATMSSLFTTSEWAEFGYYIVMPVFLVGLLAWAVLLPVAIRAMVGIERVNREARALDENRAGAP